MRSQGIADYFISEALEQQQPEVKQLMLDVSVLDELTASACSAVTGRQDAATLLRSMDAANLFIVALDDDRTVYRYRHLIQQVLRAEMHVIDQECELMLQLRAAEWLESKGDTRRATRHYLAARQPGRALGLLEDRVVTDFLHDPAMPAALDLSILDPSLLMGTRTGCWPRRPTCCCGVTSYAAASTWTCSSKTSRRFRRTPG